MTTSLMETYQDPCPKCEARMLGQTKAEFVAHLRANDEQLAARIYEELVDEDQLVAASSVSLRHDRFFLCGEDPEAFLACGQCVDQVGYPALYDELLPLPASQSQDCTRVCVGCGRTAEEVEHA